jgi:serine protease Do
MSLTPLDPDSREALHISPTVHGVLGEAVKGSSDAGDKGLKKGDVIVRAGDREVASANDVTAAIGDWKKAGRTSIPLEVTRGGVSLFVPIKIEG